MAVMLLARELKGHDWGKPNLDPLAVFYIVFAVAYTALLLLGFLALWRARHSAAVKLRGFSTICSAVLFLHIYLVLIFLAYPLNGLYKCGIEFWVMSIILPLGVALFQGMFAVRDFSYDVLLVEQSITRVQHQISGFCPTTTSSRNWL